MRSMQCWTNPYTSSASIFSESGVNPFASANMTVTVRRSPSIRARSSRIFFARWSGVRGRTSSSRGRDRPCPHESQNRASARSLAWQLAHSGASEAPQPSQNAASGRFSRSQFGHFTPTPSRPCGYLPSPFER